MCITLIITFLCMPVVTYASCCFNNVITFVCNWNKFISIYLVHEYFFIILSVLIDSKQLHYVTQYVEMFTFQCVLVNEYIPAWSLCSSSDSHTLKIPCVRTKMCGQLSFADQGPATWNELPFDLRHKDSLSTFKSSLKTHLCTSLIVIIVCAIYLYGYCCNHHLTLCMYGYCCIQLCFVGVWFLCSVSCVFLYLVVLL